MSKRVLVDSLERRSEYPLNVTASAENNCGTITLKLTDNWSEQMLYELPTVNIQVYDGNGVKYCSFSTDLSTMCIGKQKAVLPYQKQVLNIPSEIAFSILPIFDKYALQAHNDTVDTGMSDSNEYWRIETVTFPVEISFDDSPIVPSGGGSGGGGGGGSTPTASQVKFNNFGTSLQSTDVQSALIEIFNKTYGMTFVPITLLSILWNGGQYVIQDSNIKSDSVISINLQNDSTTEQYDAIASAAISVKSQATGYVILLANGDVPTIDIPILLTIQNKNK